MSRIVDIEPLLNKYDGMNEGTEFSPIHFINDLMALEQQPKQPCEDAVSRVQAIKTAIDTVDKWDGGYNTNRADMIQRAFRDLPSVTPKYTDEEIDKAQAVEQAYVDKMVELAVEESRREWLNSFDTNSATKCFEAVNLLKQRLEGGK